MPLASFSVSISIQSAPENVFAYIADLTRHPEWASDPMKMIAVSEGPVGVGSRYRSEAQSHGITFRAELIVTNSIHPHISVLLAVMQPGNFLTSSD